MGFCLVILILFSGKLFCSASTRRGAAFEAIFANPNQKITLSCNFGQKADKIRWYFLRSAAHEEVFAYDSKLIPYDGYVGECSLEKQYCNLIIPNATIEFAGRYRLEHGVNGKERVQDCVFELILGEMECHSNIRNNHVMIGNSDDPVKSELLRRRCGFKYRGNYWGTNVFAWMRIKIPMKISRDKTFNQTSVKEDGEWKIATVEDEFEVSSDDHDTQFECILVKQSLVQSCRLPRMFVQYVRNTTAEPQHVYVDNFPETNCSIDKSDSLQCSYHWTLQHQEVDLKIHQQHLTSHNVLTPGLYKCSATCFFVTGESYIMSGSQVIVMEKAQNIAAIALLVTWAALASLLLIFALSYLFWRRKKSSKIADGEDQNFRKSLKS